ncbi:MAG: hypothetical protein ABIQ02_08515, partial [Saprospiraceae bacterium]
MTFSDFCSLSLMSLKLVDPLTGPARDLHPQVSVPCRALYKKGHHFHDDLSVVEDGAEKCATGNLFEPLTLARIA